MDSIEFVWNGFHPHFHGFGWAREEATCFCFEDTGQFVKKMFCQYFTQNVMCQWKSTENVELLRSKILFDPLYSYVDPNSLKKILAQAKGEQCLRNDQKEQSTEADECCCWSLRPVDFQREVRLSWVEEEPISWECMFQLLVSFCGSQKGKRDSRTSSWLSWLGSLFKSTSLDPFRGISTGIQFALID